MNSDEKLAVLQKIEVGVHHLIEKSQADNLYKLTYLLGMALNEIAKNKAEITEQDTHNVIEIDSKKIKKWVKNSSEAKRG